MNYLKKYQLQLKLEPDSIIGPKSASAMMADLEISTKPLFANIFGQTKHESAGFVYARENLNYSPQGLANTWAKYSATGKRGGAPNALAKSLGNKPEAIANNVYGGRADLGNRGEQSGDGWKYRGIFGLQLTGRANVLDFLNFVGLPTETDPETLLEDPRNYFLAAVFFFKKNGIDRICVDVSDSTVLAVTKRVNGGTLGLAERNAFTKAIYKAIT